MQRYFKRGTREHSKGVRSHDDTTTTATAAQRWEERVGWKWIEIEERAWCQLLTVAAEVAAIESVAVAVSVSAASMTSSGHLPAACVLDPPIRRCRAIVARVLLSCSRRLRCLACCCGPTVLESDSGARVRSVFDFRRPTTPAESVLRTGDPTSAVSAVVAVGAGEVHCTVNSPSKR